MSEYREILAAHSPLHAGEDDNNRDMYSINFDAVALSPTGWLERELIKLLNDAGLATEGTDAFAGPKKTLPSGAGPYIRVVNTGGAAPEETHNGKTYERLSAQITVSAKSHDVARVRALAIRDALDGVRNTTVTV